MLHTFCNAARGFSKLFSSSQLPRLKAPQSGFSVFVVILKYFVLVTAVTNELLETVSNLSHTTQQIVPVEICVTATVNSACLQVFFSSNE